MNHRQTKYRQSPPQLSSRLFLTDGGLETDLIFNHGFDLPAFAAHTLLETERGRAALKHYFDGFIDLAHTHGTGLLLDCVTWRAQGAYAGELDTDETELWRINHRAVQFAAGLRAGAANASSLMVLNGVIGPSADAYVPGHMLNATEALDYHSQQISWLAETEVDCITALTFNNAGEAIGVVRAANHAALPVAVSLTVETDGTLPSGQPLGEAIIEIDAQTKSGAMYFMVNCAHPDHFRHVLDDERWTHRLRGMRCNASRCSHAELDASETLDAGNPIELAALYRRILTQLPWLNIVGGCCGSDLHHVSEIARALTPAATGAA
ncbi:MAG: homocysteine S-methyltransferase family protein [Gammaproteobacteria bacterium]